MTATIGILIGVGFYFPAAVTTALTLSALILLRGLEKKMPSEHEAQLHLRQRCTSPKSSRSSGGTGFRPQGSASTAAMPKIIKQEQSALAP